MTNPPVSQEDVNTLTFIDLLVTRLSQSPHSSGTVKLCRLKNELGIVEYRATVTGHCLTDLIEVQVADSRREVLLKLLEAVEDYAGEIMFSEVSDESQSEEGYAEEQALKEPEENESKEDFRKTLKIMYPEAQEGEYDLLK